MKMKEIMVQFIVNLHQMSIRYIQSLKERGFASFTTGKSSKIFAIVKQDVAVATELMVMSL